MSTSDAGGRLARRWPPGWPLRPLPRGQWAAQQPTYAGACPALIDAAVKRFGADLDSVAPTAVKGLEGRRSGG